MICTDLALVITCLAIVLGLFARGFHKMSQATDRLNASVSSLSTSVDTLIAVISHSPADDSPVVNAAADAVDLLKAKVDAAVAAVPVTA